MIVGPKIVFLFVVKIVFFIYGFMWTLKRRSAESLKDVYQLFYLDFLKLQEGDVEIVKLDDNILITRCKNPCPILNLSLLLKIDTRTSCKIVSEPVCKYVLHKLNPRLVFERNYDRIRPYGESCEEMIYWKDRVR